MILSVFPGIDLLGRAFEEVWPEACLVRGPDLLWGGDIRRFHPPAGMFDGVIGGPPCQAFSQANVMGRFGRQQLADNMIPEYERVVIEACPRWFLMENVKQAPRPVVPGYRVSDVVLNNRHVGGIQNRVRRFSFGMSDNVRRLPIEYETLEPVDYRPCVTANGAQWDSRSKRAPHGLSDLRPRSRSDRSVKMLAHYIEWQGLPEDFLAEAPLTVAGKVRVIGNGVPMAMGRAVARAVRKAIER